MPVAEGLKINFDSHSSIQTKLLETIPHKGLPSNIEYETNEFSAVCPFSGLPDVAYVKIFYIPQKFIVELKSLKYYFHSFRSVGIYQEEATDRIFKDLFRVLKPQKLVVTTIYNTRGGIDATCSLNSSELALKDLKKIVSEKR